MKIQVTIKTRLGNFSLESKWRTTIDVDESEARPRELRCVPPASRVSRSGESRRLHEELFLKDLKLTRTTHDGQVYTILSKHHPVGDGHPMLIGSRLSSCHLSLSLIMFLRTEVADVKKSISLRVFSDPHCSKRSS